MRKEQENQRLQLGESKTTTRTASYLRSFFQNVMYKVAIIPQESSAYRSKDKRTNYVLLYENTLAIQCNY